MHSTGLSRPDGKLPGSRIGVFVAVAALIGAIVAAMPAAALASAEATPLPGPATINAVRAATAPAATWKTLVLLYREADFTFTRSDGSRYHFQSRMTNTMHSLVLDTLHRGVNSVGNWSGGLARMNMDIVEVPHPLGKVDELGSWLWAGPLATAEDIDRYGPKGRYDSVIVVWQSKDSQGVQVPVKAWGLTIGPGWWANGAGFTSVVAPLQKSWWTSAPAPEEIFVHEWLHQVIDFEANAGRLKLDLHAASRYGYHAVNGTWKRWLSDVMRGRVWNGNRYIGLTPAIWRAGTPTNP